ncbi:hypothetical protein SRHO_G00061230 [Serrasalmus rhombeus]
MVTSVGTAVFVVMVKLVMTEAKLACRQDSGTFSLLVTGTQNCEDSSWKAGDGTVLAYDETYNKTVVLGTDQSPGHYRITFRTCLPDVTFTCNKEPISCEYTCPGRSDPNHGPELSRERVGIIGSALVVFLLLIIIIIISALWALRAKHTDRFQAEPDSSV